MKYERGTGIGNGGQKSDVKKGFSSITEMEAPTFCNIETIVCTKVDEFFARELQFM